MVMQGHPLVPRREVLPPAGPRPRRQGAGCQGPRTRSARCSWREGPVMGIYHTAYVAYGVRVDISPYEDPSPEEQVYDVLQMPDVKIACPDVGYLQAGPYDENRFFLVTHEQKAEEGQYVRLGNGGDIYGLVARQADWDLQLAFLIRRLGWQAYV